MNTTLTIAKRELSAYFFSPVAYVVLAVFLIASTALYFMFAGGGLFLVDRASMRMFFSLGPSLYMIFGPAITMGLIAEERKSGTFEVLMTLPVREEEVVFGKFLGAMGMVLVGLVLTLPVPMLVAGLAAESYTFDWGVVFGGYLGLVLLSSSFIAISMFFSALTKNQIIAFILGILVCIFMVWIIQVAVMLAPTWLSGFLQHLSVMAHFENVARGVIDSRDLIFYAGLTFIALRATVWALKLVRQ